MNPLKKFKKKKTQHIETGIWGEKIAERALKKKGYKILARRVRVGKYDELDLIARKKNTLIFIEVKTRSDDSWGRPADAVNKGKRMRISRAAAAYTARLKTPPDFIQFDIVEVIGSPQGKHPPHIEHLEEAFASEGNIHIQW